MLSNCIKLSQLILSYAQKLRKKTNIGSVNTCFYELQREATFNYSVCLVWEELPHFDFNKVRLNTIYDYFSSLIMIVN